MRTLVVCSVQCVGGTSEDEVLVRTLVVCSVWEVLLRRLLVYNASHRVSSSQCLVIILAVMFTIKCLLQCLQ